MPQIVNPHGGILQNLVVDERTAEALKNESHDLVTLTLSRRQLCDLELLMNGSFSPLRGFMTRTEYEGVLHDMRLPDGTLWPIPVCLDVPDKIIKNISIGDRLGLCDEEGFLLAILNIQDIWKPDRVEECNKVYGTSSISHPGVRFHLEQTHETLVGGDISGLQLPLHYDFETLRNSPAELRGLFEKLGWQKVVAFHTSKPIHRLHKMITQEAAKSVRANILLHPVAGTAKPGDLAYTTRVRCYLRMLSHYPHNIAQLSLLPIAVRMAGPREALLNAIVRQNYGCSHIIIGPAHCSPPGTHDRDEGFYPMYEAQKLISKYQGDLEIEAIPVKEARFVPKKNRFMTIDNIPDLAETVEFTNIDLKYSLEHNLDIPGWFSYPDVIDELRKSCPPRNQQGITLFFTGLSGAGKSTLAKILYAKFLESGDRPVTLLDGDIVRRHLSKELGFSKEHRNINVTRIGFVASEITRNGGVAICAPIAPYASTRRIVREMVETYGAFIEIYVSTPLQTCEERDRKGLYAKARKGLIQEFTGISDPYETPSNPEIAINTTGITPMQAAQEIFLYLISEGYVDDVG